MVEVFNGMPIRRMTTGGNYVNLTADVVLLSDYETLRAELEQVKLERDEARKALEQRDTDIAEFMGRLGSRWFLEQGWFPKSVEVSDAV